jgi:hypothetical protein
LPTIDVALGPVHVTSQRSESIVHGLDVVRAIPASVNDAGRKVLLARGSPARRTRKDLVDGEHRVPFVDAGCPIVLANESAAAIGAPQVARAVNLAVDRAARLMGLADDSVAARAFENFIRADDFARSPFARASARVAEPAFASRGICTAEQSVRVADASTTDRACIDACRARSMVAVVADRLVRRAVYAITDPTRRRVFVTRRFAVDMARGGPVVAAKGFPANGTGRRASVARHVIVTTDEQAGWGARAAGLASEGPGARDGQRTLRGERCFPPGIRAHVPGRALDDHFPLRELERMHDRAHGVPIPLFASTSRVFGLDGAARFGVGHGGPSTADVVEHRGVVPLDPLELLGEGTLGDLSDLLDLRAQRCLEIAEHLADDRRNPLRRRRFERPPMPVRRLRADRRIAGMGNL